MFSKMAKPTSQMSLDLCNECAGKSADIGLECVDVTSAREILTAAVTRGHTRCTQVILETVFENLPKEKRKRRCRLAEKFQGVVWVAVKRGNLECLKLLLEYDLHRPEGELKQVLSDCVIRNKSEHGETLKVLLPHVQDKSDIDHILTIASICGNMEDVDFLLKYGASPNGHGDMLKGGSQDAFSPLGVACITNQLEVVHHLVEAGANVNQPCVYNKKVGTPLQLTACIDGGSDFDFPLTSNSKKLPKDLRQKRATIAQILLDNGADIEGSPDVTELELDSMGSPLYLACRNQLEEMAVVLLQSGCKVNSAKPVALSPLHLAIRNWNMTLTQQLLENGADPNFQEKCLNVCPMILAIRERLFRPVVNPRNDHIINPQLEIIVKLLLRHGYDLQKPFEGPDSCTNPLIYALDFSLISVAKTILSVDVDTRVFLDKELSSIRNDHHIPKELWKEIKQSAKTPKSLKILTRMLINRALPLPIARSIEELPLPQKLKNFLNFPELNV